MATLSLMTENDETFSSISNNFIDFYMTDANGDFVKIYLYLVRLFSNSTAVSVADIADHFNCTETDVCRAIRYWISVDVLKFRYDEDGQISGIVLLKLKKPETRKEEPEKIISLTAQLGGRTTSKAAREKKTLTEDATTKAPAKSETVTELASINNAGASSMASEASEASERKAPSMPIYSSDILSSKLRDDNFSYLIRLAETYLNRQLAQKDINSILYYTDELKFSNDLIEFLFEHCATVKKNSNNYYNHIALDWYAHGIKTRDAANLHSQAHNGLVKSIFKHLGLLNRETASTGELEFIKSWQEDFGFSDTIIIEACKRANLNNPGNANFSYINGILANWHKAGVKRLDDITLLDAARQAKNKGGKAGKSGKSDGGFNDFMSHNNKGELDAMSTLFLDEVNDGS